MDSDRRDHMDMIKADKKTTYQDNVSLRQQHTNSMYGFINLALHGGGMLYISISTIVLLHIPSYILQLVLIYTCNNSRLQFCPTTSYTPIRSYTALHIQFGT